MGLDLLFNGLDTGLAILGPFLDGEAGGRGFLLFFIGELVLLPGLGLEALLLTALGCLLP